MLFMSFTKAVLKVQQWMRSRGAGEGDAEEVESEGRRGAEAGPGMGSREEGLLGTESAAPAGLISLLGGDALYHMILVSGHSHMGIV